MNYIEESLRLIESNINKLDFSNPSSNDKILKAQSILKLNFPSNYISFLKKYGNVAFLSLEVYGLTEEVYENDINNSIWATIEAREKYALPHEYIIIGDSDFGPWYVIDTSVKNNERENPVLMYGGGYGFGEFLYNELKTAMENEEAE